MSAIRAYLNTHAQRVIHVFIGVMALAALAMPRLVPARSFLSLDYMQETKPALNYSEEAAETFPGSAFFFAEDAFIQSAEVRTSNTEHIMPLEKVEAATGNPFIGQTALDRYRALECMTNAIYYEAANEPDDGQRAVAQVILNRLRHPAWPNTVCGVIYQGTERTDMRCQFTFSCDGSMARIPARDKWDRARRVAIRALAGEVFAPVGMATFYHTLAVHPSWRTSLDPVAVVGAHIFYTMRGSNKHPAAFTDRYAGRETISGPSVNAYIRRRPMPGITMPEAMPLDVPLLPNYTPVASMPLHASPTTPSPYTAAPTLPYGSADGTYAPAPHTPKQDGNSLPESTIRAEYRNTGRPII
jgi:spore germination cell wall hydrolase CwlJ-like protein